MIMNHTISFKDFDTICRICLSSKDFTMLCWNLEIIQMLAACSSVQDTLDVKFPKHICTTCYDQLKHCFQFQQQYQLSIQILTDIVLKSEDNKTDSSIKNEVDEDEKYDIPVNFTLPLDISIIKKEESQDITPTLHTPLKINKSSEIKLDEENSVKRKRISAPKRIYSKHKPRIKTNLHRRKFVDKAKSKVRSVSPLKPNEDDIFNDNDSIKSIREDSFEDIDIQKLEKKVNNRKVRQDNLTEWICDICGKQFSKKVYMRKHQVIHSENRPFECSICHKTFKLKWSMKEHIKSQHTEPDKRVMCPICGKLIVPTSINYHKNKYHKENKEKFKCDKCDKQYIQKSGLQMHIKEKHMENDTVYTCDLCNKEFVLKGSLRMHKKYTHMKEKNLACSICGKTFKMLSNMNHHINAHHKNLKPHVCTVCNKAFYAKFLLKKHMICHTGERPFTCTICGKSFGFKNVLTTHMRVHSK